MNRRLLWTFLLALLLPLAQVAAAAHEVSHVRSTQQDKSGPVVTHCDLCAVAAAVSGGGAAPEPAVLVHAPAVEMQPAWVALAPSTAARTALFQPRAPPFLR